MREVIRIKNYPETPVPPKGSATESSRQAIAAATAEFLDNGGKIEQVGNVQADNQWMTYKEYQYRNIRADIAEKQGKRANK